MTGSKRLPTAPPPAQLQAKKRKENIHDLFVMYNALYFDNSLEGVYVEYSSKMTLCAGICSFLGTSSGCRIALSEPILTRRPLADTQDTLLHEMIHASLFLKYGTRVRDGPDGHGPKFLSEAARINAVAGSNITVCHTFRDEVDASRVHWWKCRGTCARVIKRSMNRAPGRTDVWWADHVANCGGFFEKTHEPPPKSPSSKFGVVAVSAHDQNASQDADSSRGIIRVRRIDDMFSKNSGSNSASESHQDDRKPGLSTAIPNSACTPATSDRNQASFPAISSTKRAPNGRPGAISRLCSSLSATICPVCSETVSDERALNSHLSSCLQDEFQSSLEEDHSIVDATNSTQEAPSSPGQQHSIYIRQPATELTSSLKGMSHGNSEYDGRIEDHVLRDGICASTGISERKTPTSEELYTTHPADMTKFNKTEARPEMLKSSHCVNLVEAQVNDRKFDVNHSSRESASNPCSPRLSTAALSQAAPGQQSSGLQSPETKNIRLRPPSELRPSSPEFRLPELPKPISKQAPRAISNALKLKLQLWDPNGIDEPLFSASASRLGLSGDEFMSLVLKKSKRRGRDIELGEAQTLFMKETTRNQLESCQQLQTDPSAEHLRRSLAHETEIAKHWQGKSAKTRDRSRHTSSDPLHETNNKRARMAEIQSAQANPSRDVIGGVPSAGVAIRDHHQSTVGTGQSTPKAVSCPICQEELPERRMERHLELCIGETEHQVDCDAPDMAGACERFMTQNEQTRDGAVVNASRNKATQSPPADRNDHSEVAQYSFCPVCERRVVREHLESHVAGCIAQAGLTDEFD